MSSLVRAALLLALSLATSAYSQTVSPKLSEPVAELRNLIRAGNLDLAIEKGESLVEAPGADANAWLWLGNAYAQQAIVASWLRKASWASKCREAYERAVQLDGNNLDARFSLFNFYINAPSIMGGGLDEAQSQAAAIARIDAASGHLANGGIALGFDKDEKKAETEYRQALGIAPDNTRARLTLSSLLLNGKRWGEARTLWLGALERNAEDAMAVYMIGRIAAVSGEDLDNGLIFLDRYLAFKVKPEEIGEAPAHWRRGLILERLGRKDEAIAEIRKAVTMDVSLRDAQKDLERLQG
jgi:tetratricopeptide (TPR) repeat protein